MVQDLASARAQQGQLAGNELIVTAAGVLLDRYSVTFFAPDAADHGLLERQQELETTQARVDALTGPLEDANQAVEAAREGLRSARMALEALRQQAQSAQAEQNRYAWITKNWPRPCAITKSGYVRWMLAVMNI